MDWLATLGDDLAHIVYVNKKKTRSQKAFDVKTYKANYYIKNIEIYRERNRLASQKRTEERLNNLTNDETIHKLQVVLEN